MHASVLFAVTAALLSGCALPPAVPASIVSIESRLLGASAAVVESTVTVPIENFVHALNGVKTVRSSSSEGRSYIEVYFSRSEPQQQVRQVQAAVDTLRPTLPSMISGPTVTLQASATLQ